ncbi:MAG: hypothetical protein ACI85F_000866 [Bacteroidia bacterium]|jgi:hypothetical protein
MRTSLIVLLVLCCSSVFAQKRPAKDKLLNKKAFWTTVTLMAKKKMVFFEDEMTFRSGKMGSRKLQTEQGFIIGDYVVTETLEMDGDLVIKFQGINKNSKGQSLKWEGTIFGESIEGKAFLSKKGKVKKEYFFVGELKVRGRKRK